MRLIVWFLSLACLSAWAFEAPVGIRSPKGLLMGDAWTAVSNDDFTLFYNPAALGRHGRDFTFYPINLAVSAPNVLNDLDRFQDIPSTPGGIADIAMNYPINIGTSYVPGFKLFNFGLSLIVNEQADLLLRNKIHPMLDVDYRADRGFISGISIPLGPGRLNSRSIFGSQTSLGLSTKYVRRKGIYDTFALTGTDILDAIENSNEINDILNQLGMTRGDAWGFSAGLEHVVREGPNQFVFGLAALDLLDTKYSGSDHSDKKLAPDRQQINLASAWHHRTSLLRITTSLEIRHLSQQMETMERIRAGLELGIPGISLLGGYNAGYYSYGVALDLGAMKLTTGFYGLEAGGAYNRIESKRFVIYLSLFDFSFDA